MKKILGDHFYITLISFNCLFICLIFVFFSFQSVPEKGLSNFLDERDKVPTPLGKRHNLLKKKKIQQAHRMEANILEAKLLRLKKIQASLDSTIL